MKLKFSPALRPPLKIQSRREYISGSLWIVAPLLLFDTEHPYVSPTPHAEARSRRLFRSVLSRLFRAIDLTTVVLFFPAVCCQCLLWIENEKRNAAPKGSLKGSEFTEKQSDRRVYASNRMGFAPEAVDVWTPRGQLKTMTKARWSRPLRLLRRR